MTPRPQRMRLQVTAGPDLGRSLSLWDGTYFVGKGHNCDLVLSDHSVSRRHLELSVLSDGSYVAGARFDTVTGHPGTSLRIGQTELTLSAEEATSTSPVGVYPFDEPPERFENIKSTNPAMRRIFGVL